MMAAGISRRWSLVAASAELDGIVGNSAALRAALDDARLVSPTDATVLLLGETGTGKERFARAIHARSRRQHGPMICVNCAALPPALIESELFGHERGAFTGAVATRRGRFELADQGTIFLDEIADLPLDLQTKLLRVLQEREYERVGSPVTRNTDVRVIAATNADLSAAVTSGRFRADLYYRLSVFPIELPPLRHRRDDIPVLTWHVIRERQHRLRRHITEVPDPQMGMLRAYDWPGNIRELENVIERAMICAVDHRLYVDENLLRGRRSQPADSTLASVEKAHIETVLSQCGGRINGAGNAAERLGLHPNTLRFRIKRLGIKRKRHDRSSTAADA